MHPRGLILETPKQIRRRGCYIYIYIHYPHIWALLESAEAGCGICTMLCSGLRMGNETDFDKVAAAFSLSRVVPGTEQKSRIHLAQPDYDTSIATHLTELARPGSLMKPYDSEIGTSGRIALYSYCDKKTGPRGSLSLMHTEAYALTTPWFRTSLYCFNSCCVSNSRIKTLDIR